MTLTRTRYPATISGPRRQHSMRVKEALALVAERLPLDSTAALLDSDVESSHGHSLAFVTWVLEAGQLAPGGDSAREFAKTYLERPFDYSKTKAGISAIRLEVWLANRGQALFRKFVETVLEGPDTYLLVFEGQLSQTEFERMQAQTEEFVAKFDLLVTAGQHNADNMVSDLTIFEVSAAKALSKADLPDAKKDSKRMSVPDPRKDELRREHEKPALRPESRQDYDRVIAEGGISTAAIPVVFAGSRLRSVQGISFVDANNVKWVREGTDRWLPTFEPAPSARVHEADGPPGLRKAAKGSWQSCGDCTYYDHPYHGKSGRCSKFDQDVSTGQVCDAWDGRETGAESVALPPPRIRIVSSVDPDPIDEPVAESSRPYETRENGLVRSLCGSWAVFESPTAGGPTRTVIVAESGASALDVPVEKVVETIDELAACYPDAALWHRDRCIEHALAEWAQDEGVPVENVEECVAVAQADPDLLAERDAMVRSTLVEADDEKKPKPKGEKPKDDKPKGEKPKAKDEPAAEPPAPPPPPEPTDRMDEPEFYRDDLQTYYDVQLLAGVSPKKAEQKTKQRFGVKELVVTPTGEVRSPGVTDRPKPPPPPMPGAEPGVPPAPFEQPDGKPDAGAPAAEAATVSSAQKKLLAAMPAAQRERVEGLAQRDAATFRRVMAVATEEGLAAPQTIDDAFHRWVRHADGAVEDFESWLADNHPSFLPHLTRWLPADLHEGRRTVPAKLTHEQAERYEKWRRLLNMTPAEIRVAGRRVSEATTSLSVSGLSAFTLGRKSTRRLLAMKAKPAEAWDDDDWVWAGRQVNTVSRLRAMPGPLVQEGQPTEKLVLLRAWGHEPRVRSRVSEREVLVNQRVGWRCRSCHALVQESGVSYDAGTESWLHSCGKPLVVPAVDEDARRQVNRVVIDATPGTLPCLIGEDAAPSFQDLKAGRVELRPEERTAVMRRKAVWHHGPKGAASPAVWKSIVDGRTFFVTNTHRAYNVAGTLLGAVNRYHAFIKSTA